MSRCLLKPAWAALLVWRLCGVLDLVRFALLAVVGKGFLSNWALLVSLDAPKVCLCLEHASGGPAQGHLGVSPALHIPADQPDDAVHSLDDVPAGP